MKIKEGGAIGIGKFLEIPEINKIFQEHDIDWAGEWIIDFSVPDYEKSYFLGAWKAWQAAKADTVPDGFVVVPKEPTINQVKAMTYYVLGEDAQGLEVGMLCNEAKDIYKAMISAGEKK